MTVIGTKKEAAVNARISPANAPYTPEIEAALGRIMPPGVPPLVLFTTLARDERLFTKFWRGSLLDRGHLTLRQREIVILRTTARCASEYEWGVHVAFFAERATLDAAQIRATSCEGPEAACWTEEERAVVAFCDALHDRCNVDDARYAAIANHFSAEAILELLLLAGFYRTVSYLTNVLRLPLETFAARFQD